MEVSPAYDQNPALNQKGLRPGEVIACASVKGPKPSPESKGIKTLPLPARSAISRPKPSPESKGIKTKGLDGIEEERETKTQP